MFRILSKPRVHSHFYAIRNYATNPSPNHGIIEVLTRNMQEENESPRRNQYKVLAFTSAIKVLKELDHPLRSLEEAKKLRGVGDGIVRRIEEYFSAQNHVHPASSLEQQLEIDNHRKAVEALQLIHGVGTVKARNLVAAGCMSISDIRQQRYYETLTHSQKIGLRFVDHIHIPITRNQAELVLEFIRENISSTFDVHLVGSYRRGADTLGDIDVVLFHPSHVHIPTPPPRGPKPLSKRSIPGKTPNGATPSNHLVAGKGTADERRNSPLMRDVVHPLENKGLIAGSLNEGLRKWQGVVRLPERSIKKGLWKSRLGRLRYIQALEGEFRRVDLNLFPWKSRGAAMLAFTGDIEFNKTLRSRAHGLGMHLNEFGLWRWSGSDAKSQSEDASYWELMKAETEEDILENLGLEYVEPTKRNFGFLVGKKK